MRAMILPGAALWFAVAGASALAAVRYVDANSTAPTPPYTTWASAATTIQDAIDAALASDEIVVTNGVYQTGGRAVYGTMTNRVAVTKPVTVRSVNGPEVTVIRGYQVPGTTNGDGAVRCAYLTNGAALAGFALTSGATRSTGDYNFERSGGGVWCESASGVVSNCVLSGNSASFGGGGAHNGTLNFCTLTGNSAPSDGGGAYQGTLNNCTLSGNSADYFGGGAEFCTLNNCTLTGNSGRYGGGEYGCTLNNCALSGNSASFEGGGAYGGTLNNCTLTGNSAPYGGGAFAGQLDYCTLNNCTLSGNSAQYGGGASGEVCDLDCFPCTLNNCSLTGNSARSQGGGTYVCVLNNCIVYYNNTAALEGANSVFSALNYCCTTPLPPSGEGNLAADPELASASHLSAGSPCRGAGSALYSSGVDTDGEPWANPPSIGCDEYYVGSITGLLAVAIEAGYTNVATGAVLDLRAEIGGRVSASQWEFGDRTVESNRPYASHRWTAAGDYTVVLRAYNESYPGGVSATLTVHVVEQPVHYVAPDSSNPSAPYSSWATAATNIQDAVDAATVGGMVLVTNGVYEAGGRVVLGTMPSRVAVTKPLTVRSVNGPEVTIIRGYQVPGTRNGDGAVRCVYLTNGAALSGFTLTNGATRVSGDYNLERSGGGVWCESASGAVSNCILTGNSAFYEGGGAYNGTLDNCTLAGNSAQYGGGASGGRLNNCSLTGNSAPFGGGVYSCTLNNCTLTGNSAYYNGGGAYGGTLNNCTLRGNSAQYGGGAFGGTLNNCTLTGNSAQYGGGGASECTLNNCVLTGNSAYYNGGGAYGGTLNNCTLRGNSAQYGGGAFGGTLNNCTLTGNFAKNGGGGAFQATLNNCIVCYNTDRFGANYDGTSRLNYCCTTPRPTSGVGNLTAEPQLASASHLSAGSPCRGAGSALYSSGADIDGEPWANPPSIGCDEYYAGAITGPLSVAIEASYTNVATDFAVQFRAEIGGHASASQWEFGDGTVESNRPYASHSWASAGDYVVVLRAYNESYPGGVNATLTVQVAESVHYVARGNSNPLAPYSSWATAATNIQDAVDAATMVGALVLVSNGVYQTGGHAVSPMMTNPVAVMMTNRVAVIKPLTVRSVNGPEVTVIRGRQVPGTTNADGAVRCVYLANGAALVGFTLTNGATRTAAIYNFENDFEHSGGGVWCESASAVVSNCVLSGNSANVFGGGAYQGTLNDCTLAGNSGPDYGGGACQGTLNNCKLTGNSASGYGGGAYQGTLNNCTLTGNSAELGGGGAAVSTLNNCIVYYNNSAASGGANYDIFSTLSYCCTTPLPSGGAGNFTSAPLFLNRPGGDLRLQSNSPCINAGLNAYAPAGLDLDGHPRIVGGTVDVGAYEFQTPSSLLSYAWLQQYRLSTDGSADYTDPDGDGLNNWQEWRAGTDPTNALSVLRLLTPVPGPAGVAMSWQSVADRTYFLERSTNLGRAPVFLALASNIVGQAGATALTDTNAAGLGPFFYRVGVQE